MGFSTATARLFGERNYKVFKGWMPPHPRMLGHMRMTAARSSSPSPSPSRSHSSLGSRQVSTLEPNSDGYTLTIRATVSRSTFSRFSSQCTCRVRSCGNKLDTIHYHTVRLHTAVESRCDKKQNKKARARHVDYFCCCTQFVQPRPTFSPILNPLEEATPTQQHIFSWVVISCRSRRRSEQTNTRHALSIVQGVAINRRVS